MWEQMEQMCLRQDVHRAQPHCLGFKPTVLELACAEATCRARTGLENPVLPRLPTLTLYSTLDKCHQSQETVALAP